MTSTNTGTDDKAADPGQRPPTPAWPLNDPEVLDALKETFASGDWGRYHGAQCEALTTELSEYHGVRHVQLCASGTIAVELALRGLGVKSSDEVILSAYDFPGNFRAIEALAARPVLIDVSPGRWTVPAGALQAAVSDRTKAVIVSHLHGDMAPIRELAEECQRLGIKLIEDACQVTGAMIGDRRAGTLGDIGVLSFGGSKLLTAGRGGAVLTDQPDVFQRTKISNERGNEAFPLSELQAAVLRPQLRKLDDRNQQRLCNVRRLLAEIGSVATLKPLPDFADDVDPAFYKLAWQLTAPDQARSRDAMIQQCVRNGLPIGRGFRGFFRRSARRCRVVGDLTQSRIASEATVLLHHPALLGDADDITKLAAEFRRIVAAIG